MKPLTEDINKKIQATLKDWQTNPQGWTLTHSNATNGAGVYFVGTIQEAQKKCTDLDTIQLANKTMGTWYVADVPEKVKPCPKCGKLCHESILEGLGECLNCDHIASDV